MIFVIKWFIIIDPKNDNREFDVCENIITALISYVLLILLIRNTTQEIVKKKKTN